MFEKEYDMTVTNEELEKMGTGALRRAAIDGDTANSTIMAGQIAAMVKKEQTCYEIITEIMNEAEQLFKGAVKWAN
jgi:enoyl-[acyl-carrier protein] reductase II